MLDGSFVAEYVMGSFPSSAPNSKELRGGTFMAE